MRTPESSLSRRIRQRPGMYIGDVGGYGLHRLPLLLLGMGATAASEGRGDEVGLRLEEGGACIFSFNGPLWPTHLLSEHPPGDLSPLFSPEVSERVSGEGAPRTPLVGSIYEDLAIVQALSSRFEVLLGVGDKAWRQSFIAGEAAGPLLEVPNSMGGRAAFEGTRLRFVPDRTLFERTRWSVQGLSWRMEELAALHPRVTFRLHDDVRRREERHRFEGGMADFAARLSEPSTPLHAPWSFEGQAGTAHVRLVLQWCRAPSSRMLSWVNQSRTGGGTHVRGLVNGLGEALAHHAGVAQRTPDFSVVVPSAITEGLTALLDMTVTQPLWVGPIKGTLANPECEDEVARCVHHWLRERFERESAVATQVLEQVVARSVARG